MTGGDGRRRHAEISGAGLGGLAAAAALAKQGWSVRVHERAPEIRATGSGIYIAENGIRVLETLDAAETALKDGYRFTIRETRDHRNRVIATYRWPPETNQRIFVLARETLVLALKRTAERHGAEIRCSSDVAGADPAGALLLADGTRLAADLVIGADGVNSRVRESLGIPGTRKPLGAGAIRAIIPRLASDRDLPPDTYAEYWTGPRRVFYAPISHTETYLALMTTTGDRAGTVDPPDIPEWIRTFPYLEHVLARICDPLPWLPFEAIKLRTWHRGRVALIGDAAHAMAPNLGQGGGTAMMDGVSLAANVAAAADLEAGLRRWEARERPVVDRVQLVSFIYGELCRWPVPIRNAALWAMGRSEWAKKQRMLAADFVPDGVTSAGVGPAGQAAG